jgi:8-oxo-dGTP diphosphatase
MSQVKQVFHSYPVVKDPIPPQYQFCPQCAAKLVLKADGALHRWTCPRCDFIHYLNPAPAVSVLIVEAEQVLLVKRASGNFEADKWCLPCGFIEFEEDFLTAARREVEEETNLTVGIEAILSVCSNFHTPRLHSLVVVLLARVIGGVAKPGDDAVACRWVPLGGPYPELAFAADRHILERYYQTCLTGAPVEKLIG